MQETYVSKLLKSAETFLARWQFSDAELLELTISHKQLCILLKRDGLKGNLLLICIDPLNIKSPIRWPKSNLRVTTMKLAEHSEHVFRIADDSAGVEVICGGFEVKENVRI